MGERRTEQEKKCRKKSGICLASVFLHIIEGDSLQSANTFPVMTSGLLTAMSPSGMQVGVRGRGWQPLSINGPTAKTMDAGKVRRPGF